MTRPSENPTTESLTAADPDTAHDKTPALTGQDDPVEVVARAIAQLEPGEDWPTNEFLGGSMTGTRDDEYRDGIVQSAKDVLAALSGAGLLATEQEWGVHAGDADLPDGSIDMYGTEQAARSFQVATGGTVVSRRVTTWRDA